jgi:mycothiol synthase
MSSAASPPPPPLRWVSPLTPQSDAQRRELGLVRVRELYQMRRSLPLPGPLVAATRAIEVRSFRPGVDDEGFLRVNNRAFAWHPEQGGWGPEQLAEREAEPWFDPAGFLVHEGADGRIDGFCWTKVHPATTTDPALGEIYVIGADPDAHGTGLGRALTVAGLEHLSGAGLQVGMLYVEADNAPAVRLYERLGFTVHHSDAAYAPEVTAP